MRTGDPLPETPFGIEPEHLAPVRGGDPDGPFHVHREAVGNAVVDDREIPPLPDVAPAPHLVGPDPVAAGVGVIEGLPSGGEPEPVGEPDPGGEDPVRSVEVDDMEIAGLVPRLRPEGARPERARVDPARVVRRQVVEADDVVDASLGKQHHRPGRGRPLVGDVAPAHHEPACLVARDSADPAPVLHHRLDRAALAEPMDPAVGHVAEDDPTVPYRPLDEAEPARELLHAGTSCLRFPPAAQYSG